MLRLALSSLLIATAVPVAAQMQNNTPPAGTEGMGVSMSGWAYPAPAGDWAFDLPGYNRTRWARPNDVRIGSAVRSTYGPLIGRVAYADSSVAVVKSDRWALRVPVKAFAVTGKGLSLDVSPSRFDKLAKAHGAPVS